MVADGTAAGGFGPSGSGVSPGGAVPPQASTATGAGVIHDIGYQRYDGPRLGRWQIATALCWHSLRSAFGIRRGAKAKIVPVIVFVIMCAPAVVNAVAVDLNSAHARIVNYDTYNPPMLRVFLMLVFIAAQAPELVARDLRSKVLPLYFARPMRRLDYPAAKYVAFVLALLAMIDIPIVLLYVGTALQVHGWSQVWAQTRAFIPGLLVGLMWAVVLAAVGLALACVSSRRAFSTGAVAIFLFMTWILALLLTNIAEQNAGPGPGGGPVLSASAAAHVFGLISPFTVLDGVRQWLGGTNPGVIANPGNYGVYYGIMLLVFLGAGLAGLFFRYSRVDVA